MEELAAARGIASDRYISRMAKKPPSPLRQVPVPLEEADRARIIATIEELSPAVRGDDVPDLVAYIEEALSPVPPNYRLLGLAPADLAAFVDARDQIAKGVDALSRSAAALLRLMPMDREGADHRALAEGQPWIAWADPFLAAIAPRLRMAGNDRHIRVKEVREAIGLIAAIGRPPPVPAVAAARGGRKYESGPGSGLVRAVCLYRHQQGLSLSFEWPGEAKTPAPLAKAPADKVGRDEATAGRSGRGGKMARLGDALPTTTDTNLLIVAAATAFQLDVDRSELRTNLQNYSDELAALGRTTPDETDLYGTWFDTNPRKTRRK